MAHPIAHGCAIGVSWHTPNPRPEECHMALPTVLRRWAYVGVIVGAGASIAANVLHSYVPPDDVPQVVASDGTPMPWHPAPGAVVGAIFWPVALLIVIEIFARWHPVARRFKALRWIGLVPVAVVAAVVSYRHMSGLLDWWHQDDITVVIGPLAVDGLMTMAAGALIATNPTPVVDPPPAEPVRADPGVADSVVVEPQVTADPDPPADPLPDTPDTPDTPAEPPAEPERRAPRPPGRGGRQPMFSGDNIAAIRVARATEPDATQERVAQLAGVSRRTAARYWAVTTPTVNGARHDP